MESLHLQDLPEELQEELLDWIQAHLSKASSYLPLGTNYNLKQPFKFSNPIDYHITDTIFHEAMVKLGFEFRRINGNRFQYKAKRI